MRKIKTELPGGVLLTPELKKIYNKDYLLYVKEYQRLLMEKTKQNMVRL